MKFSTFHLFHRFDGQSFKDVYDYHLELIELAEELGFDGVRLAEHHFRDYGVVPNLFTMLAHAAARTSRLRLGTGIVVLPLHNPIHVAEEAAQVDVLSGGRLDLGIGRGYQSSEFEGFGIDLAEARDRFNEALEVIVGLWTQEAYQHEGKFYKTGAEVSLVPRPLQSPYPPLHVAAVSRQVSAALTTLRNVAAGSARMGSPRSAYMVTVSGETAAQAGHPEGADLVVARSVYVAPTLDRARADQARFEASFDRSRIFNEGSAPIDPKTGRAAQGFEFYQDRYLKGGSVSADFRWEQLEVIGDPGRVIEQISLLRDAGFTNLLCDFGSTRPMPLEDMKQVMRFFAAEVMPAFAPGG
jgi:alkanesulfonate monooxygenase SsuD/methylene tetrahydromethanopterin reductase-like flavin-dependent oxidoreductase (luciferase family)